MRRLVLVGAVLVGACASKPVYVDMGGPHQIETGTIRADEIVAQTIKPDMFGRLASYKDEWLWMRESDTGIAVGGFLSDGTFLWKLPYRDIDVSKDGKAWFHLFGSVCVNDFSAVTVKPEGMGQ